MSPSSCIQCIGICPSSSCTQSIGCVPLVDRFNTTSDEEMFQICSAFITPNTEKKYQVVTEWRYARLKKGKKDGSNCLDDLLENPKVAELNHWISRFIAEVRRQDGNSYPPRTIHQI